MTVGRLLGAVLLAVPPLTVAATSTAQAQVWCRWDDGSLDEVSGAAVSPARPDLLWVVEDSGNDPVLSGVRLPDRPGGPCPVVERLRVDAPVRDVEALAPGVDAQGDPVLWVADIGDNIAGRDQVRILAVAVPPAGGPRDSVARPLLTLRFTYDADIGPVDAESLVADPTAPRLWILTKQLAGSSVVALPAIGPRGWAGGDSSRVVTGRAVGEAGGLLTDAAASPTGDRTIVRDYGDAIVTRGLPGPRGLGPVDVRLRLPVQPQGEAVAWSADGTALWVVSERDDRIWRVPVPPAPGPSPTSTPAVTQSTTSTPTAGSPPTTPSPVVGTTTGIPGDRPWRIAVAVAALLAALVTTVTVLRRPRRR